MYFTYDPKTGKITSDMPAGDGGYWSQYVDTSGNPIPQWMIDQSLNNGVSHSTWFTWGGDTGKGVVTPDNPQQENNAVSNLIGIPGLPPDVAEQVLKIYEQYPNNPQLAAQLALQYIRSTDWYSTNYAGIQDGETKGLINNEADYRAYMNQANQLYQQYYGRAISGNEFSSLLSQGINLGELNKQLGAAQQLGAMGAANPAVASLFTGDELKQIANNMAGLGSQNGAYLQQLFQYAQQTIPMYMQYGTKFDRTTLEQAFQSGVAPVDIGRQLAGGAFIAANKNQIQYATGAFGDTGQLTPQELKAFGEEQAGLDSPLGNRVNTIVQMAGKRLAGIFSGNLATPTLSVGSSGKIGSTTLGGVRTDVGA